VGFCCFTPYWWLQKPAARKDNLKSLIAKQLSLFQDVRLRSRGMLKVKRFTTRKQVQEQKGAILIHWIRSRTGNMEDEDEDFVGLKKKNAR
jgi:hypothetical protein